MAEFLLADVYKITGIGVVGVGQVLSGNIRKGMFFVGTSMHIADIQANHASLSEASAGMQVGISFGQADFAVLAKHKGQVLVFDISSSSSSVSSSSSPSSFPDPIKPQGIISRIIAYFRK